MKAEQLWNKLAKTWDKPGVTLGESEKKIIVKTGKYLNETSSVLDYGCATGSIALELAGHVKEVCGLDISPVMIEKAQNKVSEKKNIRFLCGTIEDARLAKESFNVITAFSILHLVPGYQKALVRIHGLLKSGGYLVVEAPCLGEMRFPNLLLNIPVSAVSGVGLLQKLSLFSARRLKAEIEEAGFKIIENEVIHTTPVMEVFIAARKT
jgi:2-polyprenyl-3-methyl-5-hydroxy-6-metoxy-1,4-benzoquinol methylase